MSVRQLLIPSGSVILDAQKCVRIHPNHCDLDEYAERILAPMIERLKEIMARDIMNASCDMGLLS